MIKLIFINFFNWINNEKKSAILLTTANSGINQNTNIGGQFRVTQA